MKICIISCVYPPEPVISAQTSASLASEFSRLGHEVIVLTAHPNRPQGKLYPGYKLCPLTCEKSPEGYAIYRLFSTLSSQSTFLSRLLENISFAISSGIALLLIKKPEVIYANTWPLFAQGSIACIARLRKIPIVLSIQDIYPESLVSQNRLKPNTLLVRFLRWLDSQVVRSASETIIISEQFATIYRKTRQVKVENLHVIPNWSNEAFKEGWDAKNLRAAMGIPNAATVFLYGGNIGVAAGVDQIIVPFQQLHHDAYLLIAGTGNNIESCQKQANGNPRIKFISPWYKEDTHKVLATGDIFLLPTAGEQSLSSVPSKLITYMLAGKPILATALPESEIANIITNAGCGWVLPPNNIQALLEKMQYAMQVPQITLEQMGASGQKFALQHFTEGACVPRVMQVIEHASFSGL